LKALQRIPPVRRPSLCGIGHLHVGTIWAEFLVDNLGDNFIVWRNNLPNLLGILETAVICYVVDPVPGVPEPSIWAMMLIGFAGLGFAFRRSRRKVSMA
jgi:hypothetical protein